MDTNMDQDTEPDRKRKRTSDTPTQLTISRPKNMFQMCSDVLDQYPKVTIEQMNQRRYQMRGEYKGTRVVDYTSEITHCAYIRTDVTVHACALSDVIQRLYWTHQEFQKLFSLSLSENPERDLLTVASFGCGPGTDMLAVLRVVNEMPWLDDEGLPFFHFLLFDLNSGWRKAVGHFEDVIQENVRKNVGDNFLTTFRTWSLTQDPKTLNIHYSLKEADIFIFSWILSDVLRGSPIYDLSRAKYVKENLNKIGQEAKHGAYFMFFDTNYTKGINKFHLQEFLQDTVFADPKALYFDQVYSCDQDYRLGIMEEKKDLGKYYEKMGYQPKLKIQMTVRVYQKKFTN